MWRYDILAVSLVDCPLCESKAGSKCKRMTDSPRLKGRMMATAHHERRREVQEWRRHHPVEYKEKLKALTVKHVRYRKSATHFERDKD